jgi:hypothetical protein
MWREYFKVTRRDDDGSHDKVAGVEVDEDADVDEDVSSDPDKIEGGKAAFNDKAKDDAAKDEQAKQREEKETAKLLGTTSPKELRQAFWDGSRGETPDALMLRFLRARKWDVSRSFAMFAPRTSCHDRCSAVRRCASVGKWRLDNDVEGIKKKGEEGLCKEVRARDTLESTPLTFGRTASGCSTTAARSTSWGYAIVCRLRARLNPAQTDKHDRPLVWIHVAKHKIGEQSQKALQRFTIFGVRDVLIPGVGSRRRVDRIGQSVAHPSLEWPRLHYHGPHQLWTVQYGSAGLLVLNCAHNARRTGSASASSSRSSKRAIRKPWAASSCTKRRLSSTRALDSRPQQVATEILTGHSIWALISPLLDPVVRNKIVFTYNEKVRSSVPNPLATAEHRLCAGLGRIHRPQASQEEHGWRDGLGVEL